MKKFSIILSILVFGCFVLFSSPRPYLTFRWTAPNDKSIVGYRIYWGPSTNNVSYILYDGTNVMCREMLPQLTDVYFVVKSYNKSKMLSISSNIVKYQLSGGIIIYLPQTNDIPKLLPEP
jgi:hypothetical protein